MVCARGVFVIAGDGDTVIDLYSVGALSGLGAGAGGGEGSNGAGRAAVEAMRDAGRIVIRSRDGA